MRISDWSSDVCSSDLGGDQFGLGRRFQIGATERQRPLETAVLVEDHAIGDQRRPGQMVGEAIGTVAIFSQVQHGKWLRWRRWRMRTGAKSGSRQIGRATWRERVCQYGLYSVVAGALKKNRIERKQDREQNI